ncbi:hypothetical protein Acor_78350 [Acrocarpospora corrugata]|uniref:DUF35 domain-containing protein n=1 Tax=Acrocarpospora corrugata TaxID=35763 RepID=A0A5M3WAE5_9ACTN|nr:OB-fold domain-containing protein [Acrocarpospora corrugata]GES05766.1 hypothetical protein Acor_78350 [Acrocarpospora corrugata]
MSPYAPYWEACRRGELVIQTCTACAHRIHLPAADCPRCGSTALTWASVLGHGTVHTFTVVHRSFVASHRGREPYTLAWVDLPEGVRVFGSVVGCAPEDVRIGLPVTLTFEDDLPVWRPA